MADIRPFRAVRFNPEKAGDLKQLVTPPYDVINAAFQDELYERSPYNFVRLDLGKKTAEDSDTNNRYTRAAATYDEWRKEGVLVREEKPAFYVYKQSFEAEGETIVRRGFMATTRVHDYSDRVVLPHERTLKGPKIDRLDLMKATNTQMSQLFLLFNDESMSIDDRLEAHCQGDAAIDIQSDNGIHHQVWIVDDAATIDFVVEKLKDEQILIADGHHRYETAVAFRDLDGTSDEDRPRDFAMVYLANAADPGLIVWPTHRAIHSLPDFDYDAWLASVSRFFTVEELPGASLEDMEARVEAAGSELPAYVILREVDGQLVGTMLSINMDAARAELNKLDTVEEARTLDVTVLHDFVLTQLTGISLEAQAAKTNIRYPRSLEEAETEARTDGTEMVVLMNSTPVSRIREVCVAGGFMPQKSTYFYPKVLAGLVVNDLTSF